MTDHPPAYHPQPNSRMCFVCGMKNPVGLALRFEDNGLDEVRAVHTVPDRYQGYPGVVHGGVVTAMLDEVAGRTSMIGDPDHFMMTVKIEVRFRRPVPTETPLTFTGRVLKRRGRLATAHSELRLPDGTLAAEADVMLADVPPEMLEGNEAELLDWRVWPEGE